MRTSVLLPGVFLLVAASWRSTKAQTAQEGCCHTKTVRDAPAEVSELNGVYTLKSDEGSKPDPNCMDGCVYLRDNEEYCFVQKSMEEGATVVCEVSILSYLIDTDVDQLLTPMLFFKGSHLTILYWLQLSSYVSCHRLR